MKIWARLTAWMATPSRADRRQDLFLSALDRLSENQSRQLEAVSAALVAQAGAFKAYLEMFKVPEGPGQTYVMDDKAMVELEYDKLRAQGFPVGEPADFQLQWVLDHTSR
jgi:hypothetical protein